ncbi:NB-ARC domain-containing protein [Scopulibacillus cellulosilyticus]|uniref:NB-ARC domain-containing protein n=1 Tax=Scopulibacillus cellulosilyticus TaxID=2665665 RepID=A0ABW2Q1I5_9BACL
MAELEDQNGFAKLLSSGIKALRQHPDYKTKRKKPETFSTGQSYLDKIADQLGVSANTIKSWMGQMGSKYIPGRIEDAKLFGVIWIILENSEMDIRWFTELLQTTSIPVVKPAIPLWIASCLKKAKKQQKNGLFGAPSDQDIKKVIERLFDDKPDNQKFAMEVKPLGHNLPTRWSNTFIGRRHELEAIRQWMLSPSPMCLITGWAGMGKTTIALEAAYACVGRLHREGITLDKCWPRFRCMIWVSADLKNLSFNDFLNTIAYQLGRAELIDKSINEKQLVVRHALAAYAREEQILLIVDSIDTADSDISQFINDLPQGVKVILTARENLNQNYGEAFRDMNIIQLSGLQKTEALDFLIQEVSRHDKMFHPPDKQKKIKQLLHASSEMHMQLISATAGNPKALSLSIAYIIDNDIPIQRLIKEIEEASYSLLGLFEYLFGRTWIRCHEDTRRLWQVLCFFTRPPDANSWAQAAGLDVRRFHHAVEQMRTYALIQPERVNEQLHYRGHQTVIAYGEQNLSENQEMELASRKRWVQYYINYLDTYLKREQPSAAYWNYLLGRDLEKIKQEWPNIYKALEWAYMEGQSEFLIELVIRVSHFLSRVNLPLRIEYGLKAAKAARQLDEPILEALFQIDTAGWALIEINDLNRGLQQIEAGLQVLEHLDADNPDVCDLKVLGLAFKSRLSLKENQPDKAADILDEAVNIPSSPIIQHRLLLVKGDLCLQRSQYKEAVRWYEEANKISAVYGGEKTIEAYFNLGVAYVECGEAEKAEKAFGHVLYDKTQPNQIELIYYYYGRAQLSAGTGDYAEALRLNKKALAIIDSWEQTISIRNEVEQFNEVLENKLDKSNGDFTKY